MLSAGAGCVAAVLSGTVVFSAEAAGDPPQAASDSIKTNVRIRLVIFRITFPPQKFIVHIILCAVLRFKDKKTGEASPEQSKSC